MLCKERKTWKIKASGTKSYPPEIKHVPRVEKRGVQQQQQKAEAHADSTGERQAPQQQQIEACADSTGEEKEIAFSFERVPYTDLIKTDTDM